MPARLDTYVLETQENVIMRNNSIRGPLAELLGEIGKEVVVQPLGSELDLTTLAERRVRGDLIETFKIVNNVVDYGHDIFVLGRSGRNIVSCGLKVSCFRKKFFSERVIQYWNVLKIR